MVVRKCENLLRSLNILGSYSDRDASHEVTVQHPRLMAKLVDYVYDICKQRVKPEQNWEHLGYKRISAESLGFEKSETWFIVFEKTEDCPYPRATKAIIAVKGTSEWCDVVSDLRVVGQILDRDKRCLHLMKVADRVVDLYGHKEVSMAGHSLGAAFVLLVAKYLVKSKKPVETYLFNPPFPSFDLVSNKYLRKFEKSCKVMLLAVHTFLSAFSKSVEDRLVLIRDEYNVTSKWLPHLFLNRGDVVNLGYIHQFIDKVAHADSIFLRKVYNWVAPHTLFSLLFNKTYPKHLLFSANLTIARPLSNPYESHRLEQWYKDAKWTSGDKVEGLAFGRQLCQRTYNMRRKDIKIDESDADVIAYCHTFTSSVIQTFATISTLGLATSKQKQVLFLFNTKQDAMTAKQRWPSDLRYCEISDRICHDRHFEFQSRKVRKDAVTYYLYAVRQRSDSPFPFQRDIEWRAMLEQFETMNDVTNWIKIIRNGVWLLALL